MSRSPLRGPAGRTFMAEEKQTRSSGGGGPDFLCIGMSKAGTGWLFDQLRYHPDFWMPPVKEFAYLKRDTLKKSTKKRIKKLGTNSARRDALAKWANKTPGDMRDIEFLREAQTAIRQSDKIERYVSLFNLKGEALSGDVTPGYASLPAETIAEVAHHLPQTKIILLIRDPVDRAWSRISMWARQGALDMEMLNDVPAFREFLGSDKLIHESFPSRIYKSWKSAAPKLKFQYFLFDNLVRDPESVRRDILTFVGADPKKRPDDIPVERNRKAKKQKLPITEPLKAALVDHFREELHICAELLGGPAEAWPAKYGL
jgi:hypothetical protein